MRDALRRIDRVLQRRGTASGYACRPLLRSCDGSQHRANRDMAVQQPALLSRLFQRVAGAKFGRTSAAFQKRQYR